MVELITDRMFRLSELLYVPLPQLKAASHKTESIQIGSNTNSLLGGESVGDDYSRGGKWEDEEERRFFEDIPDLKDYVPKGVLGIDEDESSRSEVSKEEREQQEKERVEEEVRKLDEELAGLEIVEDGQSAPKVNGGSEDDTDSTSEDDDDG